MVNIKLLPIDDCDDCLHVYYDGRKPYCLVAEKYIENYTDEAVPIPEWCALVDA